ncbi:MAG: AMP-binding protein [Bacteroidales bacterium]|nr:AMP-binding protein [Bacteroidales bacterium]
MESFIKLFHSSVADCWDNKAISQFHVKELNYSEFANEIAVLQDMWSAAGLQRGDKISINAKSGVNWMTVFMASVTGGYVSVQLFNGFTPADTQKLVSHSDSRILYTEKTIFSAMDFESMPELLAAIDVESGDLLASRNGFEAVYNKRYAAFDAKYPQGYGKSDFQERVAKAPEIGMDDMCAIMYTSGSTGNPKGVMLNVRNFSANVKLVSEKLPMRRGENHFSVLPYAHIFGLTVDGVTSLSVGMHLCILGRLPLPSTLKEAFMELRPAVFFAVPLILSKFVDYVLGDVLKDEENKAKLDNYEENPEFCDELRQMVMDAMGGRLEAFATGGAAIPPDVESMLAFKLKTPFITGYGMTETAPVISLGPVGNYKAKSCGMVYKDYIDVKVNSPMPHTIPGEVLVKGDIVFMGYYKNPEATKEVLSADGWLRTGDVGVIDEDNILFLSGRCKNMILGTNGQNIFPEEIEVVLNSLPYVAESIVVMRNNTIHAIIVPNGNAVEEAGFDAQTVNAVMKENINYLNSQIPKYSAVNTFELRFEAFAKTPKGSIKRFMYA